jgi:hypothetical protein
VQNSNTLWELVPYTRGRGIGPADTFPHFTALDTSKFSMIAPESLDFVVITDYVDDFRPHWNLIKDGGHFAVYLPDAVDPAEQCHLMEAVGSWNLIFSEHQLQIYRKLSTEGLMQPTHVVSCRKFKKQKSVCVVRYGGLGDMIQASNVFPALKRAGYHVTVMTTPQGKDVLANDPHVDDWFIQDTDQVPNHLLGHFWDYHRQKYDLFVNLSMSVEGRLLIMDADFRQHWPKNLIQKECNYNYMEFMNELADMPFKAEQRFYPTPEEIAWSVEELDPLVGKAVIMWSLSGSSMHKATPFVDSVIARLLMTDPDVHFILVGDAACQILEGGSWANEPRVWCRSGVYSVRQTMTLAQQVDMVVGPETGVLNAVGMEPVRKVIFLSHSTEENLTKHWINTTALVPAKTPCYPCHKLHVGWGTCPRVTVNINGESCEAAACVSELDQEVIYTAIRDALNHLEKAA